MIHQRPAAALFRLLLALAIASPLTSQQDEDRPYFSISSGETFAPGAQAYVQFSAWGIDAARIRVYRIQDPVEFLRRIPDAHQFGGRYPNPRGKLTLLERLHQWKRALRRDIRFNLRQQFSESPSAHLRARPANPKPAPGSKAAYFAEAPVLNQQQLVLSFLQPLAKQPNRWESQKVEIPVRDKGVYVVEAVHGELSAYTVLVVSDIVLLSKTGRDHILYYVANRKTGEPAPDATITAMGREDKGVTLRLAADGVAEYTLADTPANDLRVVALRGRDAAFADIDAWFFNRRGHNLTGVVYTDRPVYRPGDKVHFRAILRYQQATGYLIPANEKFSLQIMDRAGKTLYQKDLTSNSQGIVHDELALEKDAALGGYSIEVRSGETTTSGSFEVEEYKKPEYEVHVTPANRRVLQGRQTQVTIDARYYFGEPVAGAKVKYSIYHSRYWFPLWYEPDEDNPADSAPDDNGNNQEATQGEGTLDADGKLTISLPTDVSDNKSDTLYRIEAGVTDLAGREISGTGWVVATYGEFLTNVRPDRWFYAPGSKGVFQVEARDYDNKPISAPVHLELRLYGWKDRVIGEPVAQGNVVTGADGTATINLNLPQAGGDYRLVASAPSAGRVVESQTYLWVSGYSEMFGGGAGAQSVQIVPDKKSYQPGDTAQIMIAAGGADTPVLVTVEGRDIRSHTLLRAKGGTAVFSYKVTARDEPAFFVSAAFFRDGELHQSSKRIKAPPLDHQLQIQLATNKPTYLPGQAATYDIDVKTPDGKPAAQTDLSLSVVDEAIYSIVKDSTPDLIDAFYGREYNAVQTQDSLTYYFSGEAGTRRLQLAALRPRTRLAQLKPEQLVKPKVRKYFPDTTFWAADITTDARGHAQAQFSFPDSLTTWRATARGSSLDDRYGAAVLKTIVRKNLILRLAVPRFFVQGDEVVVSALVHNYLQTEKQARVEVKLEGLDILQGAPTQDVTVPLRGETKVDWRVKARTLRQAKITAQALTNEESDALELELPINPPGVLIRDPYSGSIGNSGTVRFSVSYPASAVAGSRALSIRLSPSLVGGIFSALEYLTSYPYGCVEQTMSSFLPDVIVTKTMRDLNLKQPLDQAALDRKIKAGLDRLYSFHHPDGGWGWWTSDDSHPFMTAYVVAGLALARSAGTEIDTTALEQGAAWIGNYFRQNQQIPPDLRSYMAYALAVSGHADSAALDQIYLQRADLSSYGLAFLGLAFEATHDGRAGELAAKLEAVAKQSDTEAWWPASRDEMLDFSADITPETTAFAVNLLSHERPQSPLLPKAALWLVTHRNEGYWWSSTKQTAMVIYGLTDYIKSSNELHPDTNVSVRVNGQTVATTRFNSENLTGAPAISLDESKLQPGANEIQIEAGGTGRTYYAVSADHYSNEASMQNEGTISLNLLRDYYRLAPGKSDGGIVYDLQPLSGPVSQGDVIAVRLTVTGSDWKYLLVEDPIPAGTEFVKDDKLYHLRSSPPWWQYWFTERENHDDHIALFINNLFEEQNQYFYLLKVVNRGAFHISPARVQPMYQPGHQATTAAATLEVH